MAARMNAGHPYPIVLRARHNPHDQPPRSYRGSREVAGAREPSISIRRTRRGGAQIGPYVVGRLHRLVTKNDAIMPMSAAGATMPMVEHRSSIIHCDRGMVEKRLRT